MPPPLKIFPDPNVRPLKFSYMGKVKDLLNRKGTQVYSVAPDTIILDALRLMSDKNVGALLVMEGEQPVGIFSERDYARKIILKGRTSLDTRVDEIMADELVTVTPEETIDQCMALMSARRVRHLPVIADGRLAGVVSIGDVVKHIIEEQGIYIEHLRLYMAGEGEFRV